MSRIESKISSILWYFNDIKCVFLIFYCITIIFIICIYYILFCPSPTRSYYWYKQNDFRERIILCTPNYCLYPHGVCHLFFIVNALYIISYDYIIYRWIVCHIVSPYSRQFIILFFRCRSSRSWLNFFLQRIHQTQLQHHHIRHLHHPILCFEHHCLNPYNPAIIEAVAWIYYNTGQLKIS